VDDPGCYVFSAPITTAVTQVTTTITDLDGIQSALIDFDFLYGTGGTSCDLYAQFSLDGGTTWQDAAHYQFTTIAARVQFHISVFADHLSAVIPSDGALSGNVAVSGFLGPTWRLKAVSVGTYVNTTAVMTLGAA